ncbi:hypothetical protein BKA56DRAFT_35132 [Ilyonectria sp. MPI-CAGE-AT-0026]|nr:hypothetical protein BKA56DRAFT_35132 [Ilyonectria sp. MPI-CAGE-AT-0026]
MAVVVAEADSEEAEAVVVSEVASTGLEVVIEMATEHLAEHHLALVSIEGTATVAIAAETEVTVGIAEATEALVGMILEAAAHMTTDRAAAATVMEAVDSEIVKAVARAATWSPSSPEMADGRVVGKVGIATAITTDPLEMTDLLETIDLPETTMPAESAATTAAATRIPGSCADTKLRSLSFWWVVDSVTWSLIQFPFPQLFAHDFFNHSHQKAIWQLPTTFSTTA